MMMIPRNRKLKFTKTTIEALKKSGMYFFNDTPAAACRVSSRNKKSIYASYSIKNGLNADGTFKYTGRYKYICRFGELPIDEIKKFIALNIKDWKNETPGTVIGKVVGAVAQKFIQSVDGSYRLKAKGAKLKYKQTTADHYKRILKTYVLEDTKDPQVLKTFNDKIKINGSYNSDHLKDIPLNKLSRKHIQNHHERLKDTPFVANRMLSAISAAFTYDINSAAPLYKGDLNPCLQIPKFYEHKIKKHISTPKLLEIRDYIKTNLWRDPHFLTYNMILIEVGERMSDIMGIAWNEPNTDTEKLTTSGWLNINKGEIFLRDSKDRESATIYLTDPTIEVLKKLQELIITDNSKAGFAIGSMFMFPRATNIKQHITYNSYRKKLNKFFFKFKLAERTLVRATGSRKLYNYKLNYTFKSFRKSFVSYFGNKYGLQAASERMRHSSVKVTKDHYFTQEDKKFKHANIYDEPTNVVHLKRGSSND